MINIMKDFDTNELFSFAQSYPLRYKELCKIVADYALKIKDISLAITLPYKDDRGCVSASIVKDGVINIIDIKYL